MKSDTQNATPDWLQQAIAAGHKTKWLTDWMIAHLPEIKDVPNTPAGHAVAQAWAEALHQQFVDRKLTRPKQQFQYRNAVVNAIKSFDPHHSALRYVETTTAQWVDINSDRQSPGDRTTQFIQDPEAIAQRAIDLLGSTDWAEIAAGLAVVVGRRISEILISSFQPKTDYSIVFSEPVKRGDEALPLSFEIPTLAPAAQVLAAIDRLQASLQRPDHKETEHANVLKRTINQQYSDRVAKACDRHFSQFVPPRQGEDNLYTHLFRAVYATIATHWYCPPTVPEIEFRAEIQGHFFLLNEHNPDRRRNTASQRNYWDYAIGDGNGNRDGRLGIKLGQPGVAVLEVFQKQHQLKTQTTTQTRTIRVIEMPPNSPAFASVELDTQTINAIVHRTANLLISNHWAEMAVGLVLTTGRSVNTLRSESLTAGGDRVLQFVPSQPDSAHAAIVFPTLLDVQPLLTSIAKFCKLPTPERKEDAIEAVCEKQFGKLVALTDELDLRAVYACIAAHWYNADSDDEAYWHSIKVPRPKGYSLGDEQRGIKVVAQTHRPDPIAEQSIPVEQTNSQAVESTTPMPTTSPTAPFRRRKRRPVELSIDANLITRVAEQFGIPIRQTPDAQAQAVETLLYQLQQGLLVPASAIPPAPEPVPDRTITWFVDRIDALEQQVVTLQTERDQAIADRSQFEQAWTAAKTQINQLQGQLQQLEQAQVALDHLQKLLPQLAHPQAQPTLTAPPAPSTRSIPVEVGSAAARRPPQGEKRNLADSEAKIAYILDRIFTFNQSRNQPSQRWQISFPPVRELAKVLGADNQGAIKNLFERKKAAIEQHHLDSGIVSSRHNRSHTHPITDDVQVSQEDFETWKHQQETQH